MTKPLQTVISHRYMGGSRYTGYLDKTIELALQCGHFQYRKASQGVAKKMRCRECEVETILRAEGHLPPSTELESKDA